MFEALWYCFVYHVFQNTEFLCLNKRLANSYIKLDYVLAGCIGALCCDIATLYNTKACYNNYIRQIKVLVNAGSQFVLK